MAKVNKHFRTVAPNYLFRDIAARTKDYQEANPGAKIIKLGIGDVTQPLIPTVVKAIKAKADQMGKKIDGYGDGEGIEELREALSKKYAHRDVAIDPSEVFISDGAKVDSANIQMLFDLESRVAVQDPAYPVYVDTNVIAGRTGKAMKNGQYRGMVYMPCTADNEFFPELPKQKVDLIYLCSPNNPTGAVATKEQLKMFVDYARENKAVILFDSAYESFITDPKLPKSIYEIDGAEECAIELGSFSKMSGFTGIRLGWTIVPEQLRVGNSKKGELNKNWNRRQNTFFNGASNLAQAAGIAALSEQGQKEGQKNIDYYMENAAIIKEGLDQAGIAAYGGIHSPFVWAQTPNAMNSWDFFDKVLGNAQVVVTPGSGFGPSGEGYFRLSAFGDRKNVEEALRRLTN